MSINKALTRFQRSMPDIYDLREFSGGAPGCDSHGNRVINPSLLLVKTTALSADIILHQIDAENDLGEYANCLEAARAMAGAARCLKFSSFLYAHICLAVSKFSVTVGKPLIRFGARDSLHGTVVQKSW